jgi:hypothetical protein
MGLELRDEIVHYVLLQIHVLYSLYISVHYLVYGVYIAMS